MISKSQNLSDIIGTRLDDKYMEVIIDPFNLTSLNKKNLNYKTLKS